MSRIPYPTDSELGDDARAILAALPPLNIVRMFAGAPAALRPLTDLGPHAVDLLVLDVGAGDEFGQTAILQL